MTTFNCSPELLHSISKNLTAFNRNGLACGENRQAAVAVTVVDYQEQGNLTGLGEVASNCASVILTRRAGSLKNHAGQWAFPGGSIDGSESPEQAALRELEEEVGLALPPDRVLGCLDDFVTRSGFHIRPVVIWGGVVPELHGNEQEVASIHRIPCSELFRPDAPMLETATTGAQPILYMPVGNSCIATPTAAILFQFREVALSGLSTRVAEYEQPYFAWS